MNADRYPTRVFWSDDDEGFIAEAIDLPGCSAFGETQQEAVVELQSAIHAWIEAATAAGNEIPAPSNPAEEEKYSGKVLVRMPRTLHAQLAKAAKSDDVSLNQYMVFLLTQTNTRRTTEGVVLRTMRNWQSNFVFMDRSQHQPTHLSSVGVRLLVASPKGSSVTSGQPNPVWARIDKPAAHSNH